MGKPIKKITIVWENLEYGGMNTYLENLVNSKILKNIDILLITNKNNKGIESLKNNIKNKRFKLITYSSLNAIIFNNKIIKIFYFLLRPILFLLSIFQFYHILKNKNSDLIFAACGGYGNFRSDAASLISAKILRFPKRILSIHHSYTEPMVWKFFISLMDIFISRCATSIIFGSKAVKLNIKKNTRLLENIKNSEIIHHGVSLSSNNKKRVNLNKIFKTSNNSILKIGMLARIESYKGHYDLIEVLHLMPLKFRKQIKVFFVGPVKNDELIKINKKIKFYKLNEVIKITGYINCSNLEIIKKLDLVMSLTKTFEGFGLSMAEALIMKKPVLATKAGAITEFLNSKNSKLINVNRKDELLIALQDFIKNKKKWNLKAIDGYKHIMKNFNSEITAKKYFNHFNLITKR